MSFNFIEGVGSNEHEKAEKKETESRNCERPFSLALQLVTKNKESFSYNAIIITMAPLFGDGFSSNRIESLHDPVSSTCLYKCLATDFIVNPTAKRVLGIEF